MNFQPTLKGQLVTLRPLTAFDFEALYTCASDPLIWEQHPEPTRYLRNVFQGFFDRAMESKGALAAIDPRSNRIIGTSRFYWLDPSEQESRDQCLAQLVIGYTFLERQYWERGYNREMKRLMLHHAFGSVDYVLFQIGAQNMRSRRAIEKLGAKHVATLDFDGKYYVNYRIDR